MPRTLRANSNEGVLKAAAGAEEWPVAARRTRCLEHAVKTFVGTAGEARVVEGLESFSAPGAVREAWDPLGVDFQI